MCRCKLHERMVARPPIAKGDDLRSPRSSSGDAPYRIKGAWPAPSPRAPHRHEHRRHRAAPSASAFHLGPAAVNSVFSGESESDPVRIPVSLVQNQILEFDFEDVRSV